MTTHSSILAWRTPWREEPGGLQSMRSQRVEHHWVTNTSLRSLTYFISTLLYSQHFLMQKAVVFAVCPT